MFERFTQGQNVQIQKRFTKITSINDKLSKIVFDLSEKEFISATKKSCSVTEKKIRGEKIKTSFSFENVGTVELSQPLNLFDRHVFDACISAQEENIKFITVDSLFHAMTGNKSNNTKIYPSQKATILASLEKMMTTLIKIDFSETRKKMPKYNDAPPKLTATILPCEYIDNVTVNGQKTAVIHFNGKSPLLEIAKAKKQIISYPLSYLDIPKQNNTPLVIKIKCYMIRRVVEIKGSHKNPKSRNLEPKITLNDVFKKCDLLNATKWQRQDARKIISVVMEHLKEQGEIKSFEIIKNGQSCYAVKFDF